MKLVEGREGPKGVLASSTLSCSTEDWGPSCACPLVPSDLFPVGPRPFMLRAWSVSQPVWSGRPCTFLPELVTHPCLGHLAWSFSLAVILPRAAGPAWLFLRRSKQVPGPRAFALVVRGCALPAFPGSFPHLLRVSAECPLVTAFKIPAPCTLAPQLHISCSGRSFPEHVVVGWPEVCSGLAQPVPPASALRGESGCGPLLGFLFCARGLPP